MKLSSRKQLLSEADITLKSLLNEAPSSKREPLSKRDQQRYDKAITKLKTLKSEFKKTIKSAVTELNKNEEDMQKIIDLLQNKSITASQANHDVEQVLNSFWNYNKNSSVAKVIDIIQDFGETAQW